jgi:hypothetical protein
VQIETSDSIKLLLVINEKLVEMCEKNKRVQEKLHQRAVNQLIQYVQALIHNVKSKLLKFKTG